MTEPRNAKGGALVAGPLLFSGRERASREGSVLAATWQPGRVRRRSSNELSSYRVEEDPRRPNKSTTTITSSHSAAVTPSATATQAQPFRRGPGDAAG